MYPSYRGELMGRIGLNHLQSYHAYPLKSKEIFVHKRGVIRGKAMDRIGQKHLQI